MRLFPIGSMALLVGCAGAGPTAEAPCYVNRSSWRMDDPNPVSRIEMLNVNRYCGVVVRQDGRSGGSTGQIVTQPSNGDARVRRVGGAMQAEYRPKPGFYGRDQFKAQLGSGAPVLTVHVTVRQQDSR